MPKAPQGFHHAHFHLPQELFIRFRRHFPFKGDMQRGMIMAVETLLSILEKVEDEKES